MTVSKCASCGSLRNSLGCPFFKWLDVFEKKWAIRIIKELCKHNLSFNDLKRAIPGVTQGMLSERLQDLQESGLIKRKVLNTKPLAVDYSLTEDARVKLECLN